MTINKNLYSDVQDGQTNGSQAAALVNKSKAVVNEVVDYVNTFGDIVTKNLATNGEVVGGVPGKILDSYQIRYGYVANTSTFNSLRSLEPVYEGQQILVKEHTEGLGVGGGLFRGTLTSVVDDNGVNALTVGGNGWIRIDDQYPSVFWFGATNDTSDSVSAFNAACAYAKANSIGIVRVDHDCAVSQFVHPRGITFVGGGRQTYGEFENGEPTTITLLSGAGVWGWTLQKAQMAGGLRDINLKGDWTNNGILADNTTREFELTRVSVKNVMDGIKGVDLFFSGTDYVSVTCRGVGFAFTGGGTTLDLDRTIVQGDKIGAIRCQTCYKFSEADKPGNALSSSTVRIGAGQYCVDVFDITDSPKLIIDNFNAEDYTGAVFNIHDTFKAKLDIRVPNLQGSTGSIFKLGGNIQATTEINIGVVGASDSVDVTPTVKFFEDVAGLSPNGLIYMNYDLYNRVKSQIDPVCKTMIQLNKPIAIGGECIHLNGSTSYNVTFSELENIWKNKLAFDHATGNLIRLSGSGFGNGLTFRVTSSTTGGGAPNISQFSIRTIATTSFTMVDLTGSHTITADFVNGHITITTVSVSQSVVISAG